MIGLYCDHISLSPDKWERVELNIAENVEGRCILRKKVEIPRIWRVFKGKPQNAFKRGAFTQSFIKHASAKAVEAVFGEKACENVATVLSAQRALSSVAKCRSEEGLAYVIDKCVAIRKAVDAVAKIAADDQLAPACTLYVSCITKLSNF